MSGIFICYRRADSAPWAGRLYDSLVRDWGEDHVFMDVDTIAPGEDFRAVISETVANSDVVLVLIGPDWVAAADLDGSRRLDDEGDIHRTEVVSALRSKVRVIPVLVGGASMPKVADLPEGLTDLAYRNAVVLEDRRFGSDVRALHKALVRFGEEQAALASNVAPAPPTAEPEPEPVSAVEAPPPVDEPAQVPPSFAAARPTTRAPAEEQEHVSEPAAVAPPEAPGADRARPWSIAAAGAAVVVGLVVFVTGLSVAGYMDPSAIFRLKDVGAGLLPSVLGGGVLAVVGGLALDPARRGLMLGTAFGLSLPLGLLRLQEGEEVRVWCGYDCVADAPGGDWFVFAGALLMAVAVLAAVALRQGRAWTRSAWAPTRFAYATIAVVVVWVASLAIDIYDIDGEFYGGAFSSEGPTGILWPLLVVFSIIGVALAAFLLLDREAGTGALVAVAALAAIAVVNELAYLASEYESPTGAARLPLMIVPAVAVVALTVVIVIRTRPPEAAPTPDG